MELINNLENTKEISLETKQNNFLDSKIGKIVDRGINVGLRFLLPDLIEEEVINIKDSILKNGVKEGLKTAVDSAINFGKSIQGVVTGNFENIKQVQTAIKNGGIIDSVSELLGTAVNNMTKKGIITNEVGEVIKNGKNAILTSISNGIENNFEKQLNTLELLNKYSQNWNKYYENRDFEGMQKEYNKIKKSLKEIIPLENTIKEARRIENLHNLIKKNGKNFNLSEEELKLAQML